MINLFFLNLFLAIGFVVVMGDFTIGSFAAGFLIGYAALWVSRPLYGATGYFGRVRGGVKLTAYFLGQLVVSNFRVMWDAITPEHISSPGIIGVPLDAETDLEILLVANLISLTPGSLSIDVSEDRKTIYVHVMFMEDPEKEKQRIKEGLERRVLEVLR